MLQQVVVVYMHNHILLNPHWILCECIAKMPLRWIIMECWVFEHDAGT